MTENVVMGDSKLVRDRTLRAHFAFVAKVARISEYLPFVMGGTGVFEKVECVWAHLAIGWLCGR